MSQLALLTPLQTSAFSFQNRVFMAPMTRSRAPQNLATDLMATYYSQRASAGLIISEGTQVSPQGVGYIATPGIHSQAQAEAWQQVTAGVHQQGGLIFCQLWHVGRVSHPDFHNGALPVAPSALPFEGMAFTLAGPKAVVTPRALASDEIAAIVADFKQAAEFARTAGFDGVEIHGANGYLPAQFLEDGSNQRTDAYGGSLENRARFILELFEAVSTVWGKDQISVRLSPRNPFNGMHDSNPEQTYLYLVQELAARGLGMLHLMEPAQLPEGVAPLAPRIRALFPGVLILNMGYTCDSAEALVASQGADAVSFGNAFLANPDLPARFARQTPLNAPDPSRFYGGGAEGYTDYPFLT
jgi:N-ethylmaleimide reductase